MARWNPPLEIEQIKQLALITRQSPHHAESPVLVPLSTESFSAGDFQQVFQRYRSNSDSGAGSEYVRIQVKSSHASAVYRCRKRAKNGQNYGARTYASIL